MDAQKVSDEGYTAPLIIKATYPMSNINCLEAGTAKIRVKLAPITQKGAAKTHLKLFETTARDETGAVRVLWFNRPSAQHIKTSVEYVMLGKVESRYGTKTMVNPIISPAEEYDKWLKKLGKS